MLIPLKSISPESQLISALWVGHVLVVHLCSEKQGREEGGGGIRVPRITWASPLSFPPRPTPHQVQ